MKLQKQKADVLVIGGGLAGLRAAYEALSLGCSVIVVSKGPRCSTEVSGFNVPIGLDDSVELFSADIKRCGCGIGDPALIKLLAEGAEKELAFLETLGFRPDKYSDGSYVLLQPLQCSVPRLIHHGTQTGFEIEQLLLAALASRGICVEAPVTALSLLKDEGVVCGALAHKKNADYMTVYEANSVVLAAGGCSGMFAISTYSKEICGDSAALAWNAGAELVDMEFQDFEPCCLAFPNHLRGRGISSTMLFVGGKLLNSRGESIVEKYFADNNQISKIALAEAIYQELRTGNGSPNGGVYYDLRNIPISVLEEHETYLPLLLRNGIDPTQMTLEVTSAAHTCLGGVKVDTTCSSTVPGLYAAGEAMGGLHGAARIGGNAGTEVFVFGTIAGRSAAIFARNHFARDVMSIAEKFLDNLPKTKEERKKTDVNSLRQIVSKGLPLLRNARDLDQLKRKAHLLQSLQIEEGTSLTQLEKKLCFVHMAQVAEIIATASSLRRESRGVFKRSDFVEARPEYTGAHIIISNEENKISGRIERLEATK